MLPNNYQLWSLNARKYFDCSSNIERIQFLASLACLAPSSHNTQPWKFRCTDRALTIVPDGDRALSFSDRARRQMYISIGCCAGAFEWAAQAYRLRFRRQIAGNNNDFHVVFDVDFESGALSSDAIDIDALELLSSRVTNRSPYSKQNIAPEHAVAMGQCASDSNTIFHLFQDEDAVRSVGNIAINSFKEAMSEILFRRELSDWLRNNLTRKTDGMPLFGMNIPTPVSLVVPHLLRHVDLSFIMVRDFEKLIRATPAFGVISSSSAGPFSWIEAGSIYFRIALYAAQHSLATNIIAAPIEIGNFSSQLSAALPSAGNPLVLFRIGEPKSGMKHSPRRRPVFE